jgi:hypothetical protein
VSSVHGAAVAVKSSGGISSNLFLKRENVLLVVLHADHDPALPQCRVVECLGMPTLVAGSPCAVPRGAHVEHLAFSNPKNQ